MSSLRILPAVQTVATLQPHILTIELPTYLEQDVRASLGGGANPRPLELVAHELCHWFDIVGTVWGQTYLEQLFSAFDDALQYAPDVKSYPAAISLFDADRSILFPTYYKYVKSDAPRDSGPGQWRMEITSGIKVDTFGVSHEENPILFVHFSTKEKDIGRQPISVGSLLELRAIFSELAAYKLVSQHWEESERIVGDAEFGRRIVASMYDPQLITYSAAAHYVGKVLNDGEILQAFGLGSIIGDICLNLTGESYAAMRVAPQMKPWGEAKVGAFQRNRDRGFAFGNLIFWASDLPDMPAPAKVAVTLHRSGFRSLDAIYGPAEEYIRGLTVNSIKDPTLKAIRQKTLDAGRAVIAFRRLRAGTFQVGDWAHLPVPPILDAELNSFFVGIPSITATDVEFLHECDWLLSDVTRQALRAARGLDFGYTDWIY